LHSISPPETVLPDLRGAPPILHPKGKVDRPAGWTLKKGGARPRIPLGEGERADEMIVGSTGTDTLPDLPIRPLPIYDPSNPLFDDLSKTNTVVHFL
jgi:hypothetical protein